MAVRECKYIVNGRTRPTAALLLVLAGAVTRINQTHQLRHRVDDVQRAARRAANAIGVTARALILTAYEIQGSQLVGGPTWLQTERRAPIEVTVVDAAERPSID